MPKQPPAKIDGLILTKEEPSLLYAIRELVRSSGINWDEWWNEWRKGIPARNQQVTNFRIDEWVKPKYIELTQVDSESGVRHIEYYPDKENETESFIFSGTTQDLIFHIIALGYRSNIESMSPPGKGSKPPLKGFPLIELRFRNDDGAEGVKWLRLAKYTDSLTIADRGLAEMVTPKDITIWCDRIKKVFGTTKYVWKKGKSCLSYSGQLARLQGLEGYAYVPNKTAGIELFTAILKIIDAVPDKEGFNFSASTTTTKHKKAEAVTVANKIVKVPESRPVVDVEFYSATLRLPLMTKPIPLVKKGVILYK